MDQTTRPPMAGGFPPPRSINTVPRWQSGLGSRAPISAAFSRTCKISLRLRRTWASFPRGFLRGGRRLTGSNGGLYTVVSRWRCISLQRASSHSVGGRVPGPPEFPKLANFPGSSRPDPVGAAKNNEQRQSDTTPPRHGHPARGSTFYYFQRRSSHARE